MDVETRDHAGGFGLSYANDRWDLSLTWKQIGDTFQQYDNESRLLSFQSRFRWILKPGNDLFLVVNRGWLKLYDDRFESIFDRASSKLQYTFRF